MNRCIFNKNWLRNEGFAEWLDEVENDKYAFRCRVCLKNLELGRMGKSALLRHLKSSKHSYLLKERNYASFTKSWMPKAFNSSPAKTSEIQPDKLSTVLPGRALMLIRDGVSRNTRFLAKL